jgi:hypothetical protein
VQTTPGPFAMPGTPGSRRLLILSHHLAATSHRPTRQQQQQQTAAVVDEGRSVSDAMRRLLDGGVGHPLPVDPVTGLPDAAYIARIRASMLAAGASGDYRLATALQDLLFAVEPRPLPSLEAAVGGTTAAEKASFFVRHGCIVVPRVFEGERLRRLQRTWASAQSSARAQWEEAKAFGVLPRPLDGIAFANQQELNARFPRLGGGGFGRKWFDIPYEDFYHEATLPNGDDSLLDLIDPPSLMEVLRAVCGGDDIRCVHIQPRTVPPDDEGGYTSWHRDMQDVNSMAVSFPTDGRVVKAIVYLHDCPPNGGANGVVLGSHRLPFTPAEVYGAQFYNGTEVTRHKALPLEKMPNSIAFTLPAGWAAIFDISCWHTGLANLGPGDRQNMIQTYIQNRRFTIPGHRGHCIPPQMLHEIAKLGRLPASRRRVLSLPEEGDLKPPTAPDD